MAYELVYTSAPQGINRGSSGFCVVACTNGLGPRLIAALEGYSAYKPLYPHYADNAWDNPISCQHYIFEANGERQHILSRICFNGVDYTGRSNKLASHLVLSRSETDKAPGGPASLLMHEELFKNADWTIKPELYDRQLTIPAVAGHGAKCAVWESVTGDAGWGGYLAQCFLDDPQRSVYLVYRPELNRIIPKLFDEAINLLPEDKRWLVTFNSYFVTLPAGGSCTWRGVPTDSGALLAARRSPANIVIDLDNPGTLSAAGNLIDYARTGINAEPEFVPVREQVSKETAPTVDVRSKQAETPETAVAEPERPEVVTIRRTAAAAAPRRSAKWPIAAAAAVLLAAALAAGAFFVVGSVREQRAYRQALADCRKLRQTLDMVKEEFGTLDRDRNTLEARIERLEELIATVEAVAEKIDTTPETRVLFDDALGSGKLTDRRYTPGAVKESCKRLKAELQEALESTKKALASAKKRAENAPRKQLPEQKPAPEKKAEKPAEQKPEQKKKAPKSAAEQKTEQKKNLAPRDDPRTLWKKAEPLYAKKAAEKAGENISVTVALGDVKREDIKIRLSTSTENKQCQPGEPLTFTDGGSDNNVIIKTEYDENTGVLTITGGEKKSQLLMNERISVFAGGKEYPLFFKVGTSRLIGKAGMEFSDKGAVSLRIAKAQLPKRIFRGNSRMDAKRYALKCGGEEHEMQLVAEGELQCTFDDGKLSGCRKRETELKKLKRNVETEPEKYIFKVGFDNLKNLGILKQNDPEDQKKDWETFRKQYNSLLARANAVRQNFGIEEPITSLRKFHKSLPEDAEDTWGKGYKTWTAAYKKWNITAERLASGLIDKAPMKLLLSDPEDKGDPGNKTIKAELEYNRGSIKSRKEELRQSSLVILDVSGKKIYEIELDKIKP